MLSPEASRSLAVEGNAGDFVGLDRLHSLVQKQLKNVKWVKSCNFFMPNSGVHSQQESFLGSDTIKELQKSHSLCPPRALPSAAIKSHSPASVQNSVPYGPGATVSHFLSKAAVAFADDRRGARSNSQQLLPLASLPSKVPFSGEKGLLPIGESDLEARNRISRPETLVSSDRKLGDKQMESKAVGNTGQVSSVQNKEYLHINITGEDKPRSQQPGDQPGQPKTSETAGATFEGPIISSVFSLSSGSENVPEAIKWNSSTTKIKSIELLRRKIAQLIESCGKPSSLSATMTIATCVQCKSVHKIPTQDLRKGPGQSQDTYVCFKCSLRAVPTQLHFVNNNAGAAHVRNETETISSPVNKFKVRNFKPGKYYCDKCRFSTKDPLQYRKHTLQHEEIRFICSHCSYISYTKGEFQRHLVKHTGIFPYRCEYCDYGAIRNDYIVKHRRRVHERAGAKRPFKTVAKLEPKRTSIPKQSMELSKGPSPRAAFQNKLSDQLSRFSLHANKDKTHNLMLLPHPTRPRAATDQHQQNPYTLLQQLLFSSII